MEVRHINRSSSATRQPKVDTSTNLLCPRVSGSVCGVPDVPSGGWQKAPSYALTAYLTAYGFGKQPPNVVECALI